MYFFFQNYYPVTIKMCSAGKLNIKNLEERRMKRDLKKIRDKAISKNYFDRRREQLRKSIKQKKHLFGTKAHAWYWKHISPRVYNFIHNEETCWTCSNFKLKRTLEKEDPILEESEISNTLVNEIKSFLNALNVEQQDDEASRSIKNYEDQLADLPWLKKLVTNSENLDHSDQFNSSCEVQSLYNDANMILQNENCFSTENDLIDEFYLPPHHHFDEMLPINYNITSNSQLLSI